MLLLKLLVILSTSVSLCKSVSSDSFELSVIHLNDFHARYNETNLRSSACKDESTCIGGFSRMYALIQSMLNIKPNSVLLNAGDNLMGTLYYTLGKWNITQEFMNKLPFDAMVLGNHEFEDGIKGLVPFIKSLSFPVVCANIDDSQEPAIQGTYTKSTVIERAGKRIGIIGVIYSKTNEIAMTGKLRFYPESESVNAEAERLVKEEGVFTNIVLSHVGYDIDKEIAANSSEKIGLLVGGHSHTFLYTGDNAPGPDTPEGPYPTIIQSKNGKNILIVQASSYSKYLGNITVYYDSNGEMADYEGFPIFIDHDKPKDKEINQALIPWNDLVNSQGSVVIGSTLVKLSKTGCLTRECTIGNFITDAFVFSYVRSTSNDCWAQAAISFVNSGGIRSDIEIGDITHSDMLNAQPFSNTVDIGDLEGKYIKAVLEQSAGARNDQSHNRVASVELLQVSGIHVVYDLSRPFGDRVTSVQVRCQKCLVPVYENLDLNASYKVVVPSFITRGGDGFTAISDNIQNLVTGEIEIDVFRKFLQRKSPIFAEEEGRITVIK